MNALASRYDLLLVALSVVIAVLAAGAALDLAGRVTAARGGTRTAWLGGGALAMGLGIWSMHYTGMLAFHLPVLVRYHVATVALSLLAAVLASAVALYVASREQMSGPRIGSGSVIMGAGIATMHYTGMAAMRLPATMEWDLALVALSVVIAVVVAAVALWLAFHFGHAREAWTWRKAGSALLMGAAIPAMHYTGMAAAVFHASNGPVSLVGTVSISALGAQAIAAGTLLAMLAAIATSLIDRRFAAMHHAVRSGRDLLEAVVTSSGEAIFAKDVAGQYILANKVTETFVGQQIERLLGHTDAELLPATIANRLQQADRRILADGTSVYVARDITARKRAEEEQRILLRELQAALAEVKTLRGLVTVCAKCRRVRNDDGSWQQIESYVRERSKAEFSHGLCADCAREWEGGETV